MLRYLTMTGLDVHCDLGELLELQAEYPKLEFGVLVSKNNTGCKKRYPSLKVIEAFANAGLHMSCHVCGELARTTMKTGKFDGVEEFLGDLFGAFQRFQYNINGCKCTNIFRYTGEKPIIIQAGTKDGVMFFNDMITCDRSGKVQCLVDSSGGRGEFAGYFEPVLDERKFVGYAGGLGVDNISRVYLALKKELGDKDFWLDMESGVRNDEDWFDTSKVWKVCDIIRRLSC